MSDFLALAVDFAWGLPLVILLLGGGFYLVFVSKLKTMKGLGHAVRLVCGTFHHGNEDQAKGQLSHFRALTNALSSTVGMGNIAGVAVAIQQGGPGAIFWMWVAAIIGMNTKFFECTLSTMYRGKNHKGEVQGGPMYVISEALPKLKFLGVIFALAGLIGTLSVFNANQLAGYLEANYQIPALWSGLFVGAIVFYITMGGVTRIGEITSKIVPSMCVVYVLACLGVILGNLEQVPGVLFQIVAEAFSGRAASGGATGLAVTYILRIGMKRAAFSNEAGIGTAPMAHSNAHTAEPVAEGLVAMLGPFVDTIIVCTLTALTILIGLPDYWSPEHGEGVLMTQKALESVYGGASTHVLGVAVFLFGFSTIIGYANYNIKCWDYLSKGRGLFKYTFTPVALYSASIVWGSLSAADDMVNLLDTCFAIMAVPNMIAVLILAPKVKVAIDQYFERYLSHPAKREG